MFLLFLYNLVGRVSSLLHIILAAFRRIRLLSTKTGNIWRRPLGSGISAPIPISDELDFNDVSKCFQVKTNAEILRALLVFRVCTLKPFVLHAKSILDFSRRILGEKIWTVLLKKTFFGHFCAGETGDEIQPVIAKLEASGLRPVLDYAAEADIAEPSAEARRDGVVSARTYDYRGESECDANAAISLKCIETAGRKEKGFAAIKLTALGKPELLEHLSNILTETSRLFRMFSLDNLNSKSAKPVCLDSEELTKTYRYLERRIGYDDFKKGLKAINLSLPEDDIREVFNAIDVDKSGEIDYLEWINFLDPRSLGGFNPTFKGHGLPTLSEEDLSRTNAMISRLEMLAEAASQHKVRLMIDAEQTYSQPAIDHLVLHLQRKYNRSEPIIFGTYQCYLRDSYERLLVDLERARREGFFHAAKIVRGAYMKQERKRAAEKGYHDPVWSTLDETHENYHRCLAEMLSNVHRAHVMCASHNENSIQFVTQKMKELNIPKDSGVYFGQLLGMCDHVSFNLGVHGYQAYKYVPYGPVKEVLPYLVRRAEENSDLLGSTHKERKLLWHELLRRAGVPASFRRV